VFLRTVFGANHCGPVRPGRLRFSIVADDLMSAVAVVDDQHAVG